MWHLLLAISQHLQHLWTSNHFHSLCLIQLHTMQCNAMQCNAMQCNAMQCNTDWAFYAPSGGMQRLILVQTLIVMLLYRYCDHVASSLGHISTYTAPMDLQPLSFALSDPAAHNAMQCNAMQCNAIQYNTILIGPSTHHQETCKG